MSTENLYFDLDETSLKINYSSFAGLSLIKARGDIGPFELFEIAPYLTVKML
jgi:hypothetical protein